MELPVPLMLPNSIPSHPPVTPRLPPTSEDVDSGKMVRVVVMVAGITAETTVRYEEDRSSIEAAREIGPWLDETIRAGGAGRGEDT